MNFKRLTGVILSVVFTLMINSGSAVASDKDDVVATVNQYLNNLDDKTLDKALAVCDSQVSIIDEFPPHEWHGPTACADWWKAYNAYNEKSGITDGDAPLGTPWTVDVTGDRAYFVAPMTYTFKQHGKPVKETAAFAVSLRRTPTGWRITGWAFSKQKVE
jgi:hypothetical protein